MKWPVPKIDFTSVFLSTGDAKPDVYVIPPHECRNRCYYWFLLTSAYGLVNANAKWQEHCDPLFHELRPNQSIHMPQLFYSKSNSVLNLIAVKIVDDVLTAEKTQVIENFISQIKRKYKLGTVVYGPGNFLVFGSISYKNPI